jgi:hypothetical protein
MPAAGKLLAFGPFSITIPFPKTATMKTFKIWGVVAILAALILIQIVPAGQRENPPVTGEIEAPSEVLEVLRRACYDCHSNQTRWPWYSRVAPVSWMISRDVRAGRFQINFSTWQEVPAQYRILYRMEIVKQVEAETMPLPKYLWLHRDARLDPGDIDLLRRWAGGDLLP